MTSASPSAAPPLYREPSLAMSKRVEDLLERLTLDERLAMLHQYVPAVPRLDIATFRTGTEALHGVAGLGVATVFPQAVGLGASWDEDLVRAVAEAVSVEARAFHRHRPTPTGSGTNGLQIWSPVVNLLRDPRWGRNEEGYSEDPLHTARVGTAYCQGLSGDHPTYLRAAPVLKHFLAYNNENDRCVTSSGLRPRVLHEYDLAAFRPIIASGAATGAMAAYNLVNGRPCHVSPLIERELRAWARPTGNELFVVSDEAAPSNLVDLEHYFDGHAESHAAALKAGIDSFTDHREDSAIVIGRLREALERGLIEEEDVNRAVHRQLQLRFRLGEFDQDLDPYAGIGPEVIDCPEHRALARRAATESMVLLKNDGLLPLDPARAPRIAVIGPHADTLYEDWYSGTLPYQVGIATGLRAALAQRGGEVVRVQGADRIALRSRTTGEPLGGTAFDLQEWGDGVLTLCEAGTGRYLSLFAHRDLRLSADSMTQDGSVDVTVTLTNTGSRPGSEVVQLYVRPLDARYQAPRLRLADFSKVRLEPGETRELLFRLSAERLAHWDVTTGAFTVDPGDYEVLLARSAENIVGATRLTVTGPAPSPRAVVGRRTLAVDFDDHADVTLVDATRASGDAVAPADPARPATLLFRSVDLTGAVRFEAEAAREGDVAGEPSVELRAGERKLARIAVPVTGDQYAWTTVGHGAVRRRSRPARPDLGPPRPHPPRSVPPRLVPGERLMRPPPGLATARPRVVTGRRPWPVVLGLFTFHHRATSPSLPPEEVPHASHRPRS